MVGVWALNYPFVYSIFSYINPTVLIHKIQSQKLGFMGFVTGFCLNFKADCYSVLKG